jgi:hypothetical protein
MVWSIGLSIIAIIISIISIVKSSKLTSANIELYINERITNTKERVGEISIQMAGLTSQKKRTNEEEKQFLIYKRVFQTTIEANLNAYEEACSKYIDNKIDKKRFQQNYRLEIPQLVENEEYKQYFGGESSRYSAILQVNKLFNKKDKK